jgi:uncharacterized lipoprotein YmbA
VERHDYLLRPAPLTGAAQSQEPVRLLRVDIAPYLDQDGIVLQTGAAEIHAGRQHVWAEPLDDSIRRYLQVAVSRAANVVVEVPPLGTAGDRAELVVRIHQLHGDLAGQVRLVAEWTVRGGEEEGLFRFEQSVVQRGEGYPALVDAHAELLDGLAEAIAASLPG